MLYSKLALVASSFVSVAWAHQNLHELYVNGVSVGYEKCIRRAPSNSPVTDVLSTDMRCNVNGLSGVGVDVCSVKAGDELTVLWDTSSHPGPIQHFLYGPVANAATADGAGPLWTKIDVLNVKDGKMANVIMMENGGKYTFKLPQNLASGDYLLRSEMLALHGAQEIGGGQFYMGCAQIRVSGPGGNCSPKFSLPGIYKADQPEIYIPNNYNGFNTLTYTAPGGPVATCVPAGGATSSPATTTATSTTVRPTSTPTSTSTSTTPKPTTTSVTSTTTSTAAPAPTGTAPEWAQCAGIGYNGPTCAAGLVCKEHNPYYSQCVKA
ncbi:hypothetical protein BJ508DRAFT_122039 [Ascobolus immersus RN42]|uniref:AA9 family lytic polysaccharide monooxygenase n=1 Tax=Ascobolus immersus RN42 TaxID=1160509 RepID=A0A3N4IRR7_ASCIM|nr:hypothetical protein BJ508DRAFT_122039 [Ascobolus immersus RN42]